MSILRVTRVNRYSASSKDIIVRFNDGEKECNKLIKEDHPNYDSFYPGARIKGEIISVLVPEDQVKLEE